MFIILGVGHGLADPWLVAVRDDDRQIERTRPA
jgi:hypothetical protein